MATTFKIATNGQQVKPIYWYDRTFNGKEDETLHSAGYDDNKHF